MTTDKENIELKPCPFCGGVPKVYEDTVDAVGEIAANGGFYIGTCSIKCRVHFGGYFSSREAATTAWNTRAEPQAPQVDVENDHVAIGVPKSLHPDTKKLIANFAFKLAAKLYQAELKYGYSNGWKDPNWMDECRHKLVEHIKKGDPRDVAAYCAFLDYHAETTAISIDFDGLKKEYGASFDLSTFESAKNEGWNNCIDHLAAQGHLSPAPVQSVDVDESYFHLCNGYPHNEEVAKALETMPPQGIIREQDARNWLISNYFVIRDTMKDCLTPKQPQRECEWRGIESAPKDGTKFIGYNGQVRRDVMWSKDRQDFDVNGWSCFKREYTHWMPQQTLPTPPETEE